MTRIIRLKHYHNCQSEETLHRSQLKSRMAIDSPSKIGPISGDDSKAGYPVS